MAGNADWVIDADSKSGGESNPQRILLPHKAELPLLPSETYWTGGISAWAIDLVKQGYYVETLPEQGGVISYGKSK